MACEHPSTGRQRTAAFDERLSESASESVEGASHREETRREQPSQRRSRPSRRRRLPSKRYRRRRRFPAARPSKPPPRRQRPAAKSPRRNGRPAAGAHVIQTRRPPTPCHLHHRAPMKKRLPPPLPPRRHSRITVNPHARSRARGGRVSRLSQLTVPSMPQSVASTAAKSSFVQIAFHRAGAAAADGASRKTRSWPTTGRPRSVDELSDAEVIAMPDAEYMNEKQMAFFRLKLRGTQARHSRERRRDHRAPA